MATTVGPVPTPRGPLFKYVGVPLFLLFAALIACIAGSLVLWILYRAMIAHEQLYAFDFIAGFACFFLGLFGGRQQWREEGYAMGFQAGKDDTARMAEAASMVAAVALASIEKPNAQ